MSSLSSFINKPVTVLTTCGRSLTGTLISADASTNLVLSSTKERTFSEDQPPEIVDLGVYIVRGEAVAVCGIRDEEDEEEINWENVRVVGDRAVKRST